MNILTADIGGTKTKMCICNEQGQIQQFREYETESSKGGPHVMEKLIANLAEFSDSDYDAIGISTAGQVDANKGYIVYANANIPDYTGTRISDMLQEKFNKPVKVENDVNSAALGEMTFGAAKDYQDFLCLTFGTGIGGAIVINRQIYRGADGVAAEFGHMFTHPLKDKYNNSSIPFYERYASTTALISAAQFIDANCLDGRQFFQKVKEGHEQFSNLLEQWVDEVSIGLASLIHIFNPPAIIVGGGVMEQDDLVKMVETKTKSLIMDSFANLDIMKASLGNKAGVLGAASLFLR